MKKLLAAALFVPALLAQAQYVWVDEKGVKQFSDRPPPASAPGIKILKAPGLPPAYELDDKSGAAAAASAASEQPKRPPSVADRNAEYRKRQTESAENAKKADEEATRKAENKLNCDAAARAKATYEGGARVGTTQANGERGFMDDAQRAEQLKRANKVLEGCKST